jgi:hypothetical protein
VTEDEKMSILNEEGIILKSPVKISFGKTSDSEPFEFIIDGYDYFESLTDKIDLYTVNGHLIQEGKLFICQPLIIEVDSSIKVSGVDQIKEKISQRKLSDFILQ